MPIVKRPRFGKGKGGESEKLTSSSPRASKAEKSEELSKVAVISHTGSTPSRGLHHHSEGEESLIQDAEPKNLRDRIADTMEGNAMQSFTTFITIFALYGDDLRLYGSHKDSDQAWYGLYFFCLVVFASELTINCIIHAEYKFSFFFWLDLIATLSLVPDIPWIVEPMYALYSDSQPGNTNASMARAGRAARAGTRAGRIIRLLRLVKVRFVKVVNIRKMLGFEDKSKLDDLERAHSQSLETPAKAEEEGGVPEKKMEASNLGKVLSEQTTRRVIVGVLLMLFTQPQLDAAVQNKTPLYGLEQLFWFGQSACSNVTSFRHAAQASDLDLKCNENYSSWLSKEGWDFMVYEYSEQSRYRPSLFQKGEELGNNLLFLEIPHISYNGRIAPVTHVRTKRCTKPNFETIEPGFAVPEGGLPEADSGHCQGASGAGECCWQHVPTCGPDSDECPWRNAEMEVVLYSPPSCKEGSSACAGVSVRAVFLKRQESETDAANSMLTTTFIVILLGVGAMVFATDTQDLVIAPIEKMVTIVKQLADDPLAKPDIEEEEEEELHPKKRDGQIETSVLENTILKIGALLQVGFGEGGALIIGKNLNLGGGELQIMAPGRKMFALFGYCDIRDFLQATECLQEEVMVFVNKIARVVHMCVHEWSGAVSKNLGESFLLTWTSEEVDRHAKILEDGYGTRDGTEQNEAIGELADQALVSFIKIIAEVRRASDLAAYARHPKIIPKFGMDFRVGMGFTLHCGWAIEAAIGSMYKVDASYISPHATFCAKLQEATIEYGVDILFTEAVHGFLSSRARDRCRKIDQVKVGEDISEKPMGLFTFDVNQVVVTAPDGHLIGQMIPPAEMSQESLQSRGIEWMFSMDQDIVQLQDGLSLEFQSAWRQAFQWYTNGAWSRSFEALQRCCQILSYDDGPAMALARYMSSMDVEAPSDWGGFRVLDLGDR